MNLKASMLTLGAAVSLGGLVAATTPLAARAACTGTTVKNCASLTGNCGGKQKIGNCASLTGNCQAKTGACAGKCKAN
jgi:hypothetical protein